MRGRLRVYSLVLLAVAAAVAAALETPDRGSGKPQHYAGVRSAPLVLPAEPSAADARRTLRRDVRDRPRRPAAEDLPPWTRLGRRARLEERRIRGASEVFVAGLLRWEAGAAGASARRAIRTAATAQLAAFVLSAPPRLPTGTSAVPRGHVATVELLRRGADRALAQVALSRPGTGHSVVLVELVRREERWLAAALR